MNKLLLIGALLALGLAGCASTPSEDTVVAAQKNSSEQKLYTQEQKDAMTEEEKVAVYNERRSDEAKMICRKEVVTGSHRKKRVCRTVAQRKQDSESARDALSRRQGGLVGGGN